MTFDEYPKNEFDGILYDGDEYHSTKTLAPCFSCGKQTHWYSLSFMAHLCSTECADKEWNNYWGAEQEKENI